MNFILRYGVARDFCGSFILLRKIILPRKLRFAGTNFFHSENLVVNISVRKIILEVEYFKSMIYQIFQENNLFHPEMILRPSFYFKETKVV